MKQKQPKRVACYRLPPHLIGAVESARAKLLRRSQADVVIDALGEYLNRRGLLGKRAAAEIEMLRGRSIEAVRT
jgi:Arc/MetJ-type ribon-helix-helix transcriptional regulator